MKLPGEHAIGGADLPRFAAAIQSKRGVVIGFGVLQLRQINSLVAGLKRNIAAPCRVNGTKPPT